MNDSNSLTKLTIYPNPVKDELIIETEQGGQIEITNLLGEVVSKAFISRQKSTINTADFSAGVYFLKLNTGREIIVKKIIKD